MIAPPHPLYCRSHGAAPYRAAVLHGGPGAPGSAASLCRALSGLCSLLEPWQTKNSVSELLAELHDDLTTCGEPPFLLVGHSWGAWLGWMFAARFPELVAKLILVGSGPFEQRYAKGIMECRLARLSPDERAEVPRLVSGLQKGGAEADGLLQRFGQLMNKADSYDPVPEKSQEEDSQEKEHQKNGHQETGCNLQQHVAVWNEAEAMRRSGELLRLGHKIVCPVVAVQGEYDPHGCEGVQAPLAAVLNNFQFVSLPRCGHSPWLERQARSAFMAVMARELRH
ncbi:MAG: alpha/beta fold hydrolase [Desulfovibrio sp.]|uniref:alpha/beta fold hydrolase n=1 Tax=Desulfovibrio sp. 7SRBS1 TaxID=3378064 RepID=UPI003B3E647B